MSISLKLYRSLWLEHACLGERAAGEERAAWRLQLSACLVLVLYETSQQPQFSWGSNTDASGLGSWGEGALGSGTE